MLVSSRVSPCRVEEAATPPARICWRKMTAPRSMRLWRFGVAMRYQIATLVLTMLLMAPAAQARVSWIVRGHGFGHGVGMSQYGAYGFAVHGKGYRYILGHYYAGTTIGQLPGPRIVRVLLDISGGDVGFSGATSACGEALSASRGYEAHRSGRGVVLRSAAGKPLASCGRKLRAAGHGQIEVAGIGDYR